GSTTHHSVVKVVPDVGRDLTAVERGLDGRDDPGQWAQPGERLVVDQELQELTRRHGAVRRFPGTPLTIEQRRVKPQQAVAQHLQTLLARRGHGPSARGRTGATP